MTQLSDIRTYYKLRLISTAINDDYDHRLKYVITTCTG